MNAFLQNFLDWPLLVESLPTLIGTGLVNTLILSVVSTALGIVAGMALALCAVSHTRWLTWPVRVFVDVFRGLPAALVILVVGQGWRRWDSRCSGRIRIRLRSSRWRWCRRRISPRSSGREFRASDAGRCPRVRRSA